ncbi:MAG: YgiT-type zinc finger protein [Anaerolineae bacterium]|nr:YgiT-type zinc finger protein [Anaerolineae bacterium]
MIHTCNYCGEAMHEEEVTHIQTLETGIVIVEHVPALVCGRCGNRYYTPETYDRLYALIHGDAKPLRVESVPVLDMRQSAA